MATIKNATNIDGKSAVYDFVGNSEETKPEAANIGENSTFTELDTGNQFYRKGNTWATMRAPGGGSGGGLPINFPTEDAANANKFLGFDANGDYTALDAPEEIPSITGKNGKILGVTLDTQEHEQTEWVNPPVSYPTITGKNGKILGVTLDLSDNEQVEWVNPPADELPSMTGKNGKVLGVTLDANDDEQAEWVDKDIRFTATFSVGLNAEWECDKTISEILAAYQAGKMCECVAVLAQDTYALGTLSNANTSENVVVFSLIVSLGGMTKVALFVGSVETETDVWTAAMQDIVPTYDDTDIGKVLGVVDDGDGGAVLGWVTPQ